VSGHRSLRKRYASWPMPERPRFHIDESLSPTIARAARLQELDITDSQGESLLSHSDREQWEFCQREGRVLITSDADFLRICRQSPNHFGIVFCLTQRIGAIVKHLELLSQDVTEEMMQGRIDYVR
jgi:predicted nuclease of predicted toxin-antitoxin system